MTTFETHRALFSKLTVCLGAMLIVAAPSAAQPRAPKTTDEPGARVWLGCWAAERAAESSETRFELCIEPTSDSRSLDLTFYRGGEVEEIREWPIDGLEQLIRDGRCRGWGRGSFSADENRLFLRSDVKCQDGRIERRSVIASMVSATEWVEFTFTQVADERLVTVRRHFAIDDEVRLLATSGRAEVASARDPVFGRMTISDVIEALESVDPPVVEAMLLELRPAFSIDRQRLIELSDAEVPPPIIDLMVALSFPYHFLVAGHAIQQRAGPVAGSYASGWSGVCTHAVHCGMHGPYFGYPPMWLPPDRIDGGRVIRSRGYTRGYASGGGGSGAASGSGASASSSSGSANSSGYSSSGNGSGSSSSSTRRAVPK